MNLVKNLADMILENLAIVIVVVGLVTVVNLVRLKNYTSAVVAFFVFAILVALCGAPELFGTIGNQIISIAP